MHHPNPDMEENKIRDEQAEKADPAVGLYRRVHSLIDAADNSTGAVSQRYDMEAKMTLRALVMMLKQSAMQQGLQFGEKPKQITEGQPKQIMPLMEGGGGGRQSQTEEEVDEDIQEEERISRLAETGRQGRVQEAMVETTRNRPKRSR